MNAQKYLEQVEMIDTQVHNKLIEQRQWKDLALSITANMDGEKVKSSGGQSKMADAVIECLAMEKNVADAVHDLIKKKESIIATIEKLYSPTEYKILHMRYIQYISLSDIANKLKRDYTWVTTTHGRALKNVQRMID